MASTLRPGAFDFSSKASYGLHVLVDPGPDVPRGIDIVAIHGLNGHFRKTWTDTRTTFDWLRDAIPKAIPEARIMTYSYNSAVQFSKCTSGVPEFADQFLEHLSLKRASSDTASRPVVFICHSLGGILLKQAIVRAFEQKRYASALECSKAVVFMGTPHRGSSHATWGTILSRILKIAAFGASTNTQLTKDLQPKSKLLENLSRSFLERAQHMQVVSFYETDKMDFFGSKIVEKDSAIIGFSNEKVIPLSGDHRTICRFQGEADPNLKIVLETLASLSVDISASQDDAVPATVSRYELSSIETKFITSLATSIPEAHKARNPSPVKGTCVWLLRHTKYKGWLLNPYSSLLWLSADPGCGKSVMASFLIDHHSREASETADGPCVCYFFFKSDNPEQQDATFALQAILRQLLCRQPHLVGVARACLEAQTSDTLDALWAAFIATADCLTTRETICFLDGLDECEPQSRKRLTRLLSNHFSAVSCHTKTKGLCRLKVLIISRPDTSFKLAFDRLNAPNAASPAVPLATAHEYAPKISMIRLRGEDEIESVTDDVSMVIKSDISELAHQGLPLEILQDIERQLIARADRTFLWVSLILQLIKERVEAGATRGELFEILQSRDIDVIYEGLLRCRPNVPGARQLLGLILGSYRPLTVEELSIGLAVRPRRSLANVVDGKVNSWNMSSRGLTTETFQDVENNLVFPYENHIKSLCGHFVRIVRNSVYFVHETAKEFLLSEGQLYQDPAADAALWKGSMRSVRAWATVVDICVAFIYCYACPPEGGRSAWIPAALRPFVRYASVTWPIMFREVAKSQDLARDGIINYYHNLCHPRFPGFDEWASIALGVSRNVISDHKKVMSLENLQDYCILTLLTSGGHDSADEDEEPGRFTPMPSGDPLHDLGYSQNPGSLSNHNFPLKVDREGIIRLDFNQSRNREKQGGTTSPRRRRDATMSNMDMVDAPRGSVYKAPGVVGSDEGIGSSGFQRINGSY